MLPTNEHSHPALIIVDMQNFFFRQPERRKDLPDVVENINRLIDRFDAAGLPVFHVTTCFRPDGADWDLKMKASGQPELIAGTLEAEILADIHVSPDHRRVVKTRYSAFFKTGLADQLHSLQVDLAVVVGAYTHYCVNATVFDAYCHDFIPCLITDAVTSHLPEESAVIVERMRRNGYHLLTTAEFLAQVES